MDIPRCSGIILHPTSLPGPYGVGVLGQAAYAWVDFLQESRQSIWQVLPLGPTGYGDSPYQSFSTFAGNPYLICLETLVEQGLLDPAELADAPVFSDEKVDFGLLYEWKLPLLFRAATVFAQADKSAEQAEFRAFCAEHTAWLDDYSLFMALKDAHDGAAWNGWEMPLRSRDATALTAARTAHAARIHAYRFIQWIFFRQWLALKEYANQREIRIVGDIPIYVALDSADAWSRPEQFFFDDEYQPTVVAGVPPDYFSTTGQLWGNPIYRWAQMAEKGFPWWIARIRASLGMYDIVRIDHFRGFAGYWEVPAGEATAENGRWVTGPGSRLFEVIQAELGELPIIAEDLGEITPDVIELRDRFHLPGMKILQFAFASDAADKFLPHNYTPNFIVYTGTHDNDTTRGWYRASSAERERDHLRRYLRTDGREVAWTLIEAALRSVAQVAVVPLQDVLNLDTEARMNLPGTSEGNWQWRLRAGQIDAFTASRLREATILYGRDPQIYTGKGPEAGGQ
ncbi:MAG: 4-alpha-glucanotransferase [Caldilineaceae bacterium]|nr:4-alpha-glucanotransferase [Caldilineaceae bacterium]HRJ42486.1 4-alpha-glucanotransferase [Caldilineaceae bacterium]